MDRKIWSDDIQEGAGFSCTRPLPNHHNAECAPHSTARISNQPFSLGFARGLGRLKAAQLPHFAAPELAREDRPTRFS